MYSCGERMSTSGPLPMWARTSSLNARIVTSSRSTTGYSTATGSGTSVVTSRPSAIHLPRPPSSRRTSSWPNRVKTHAA
ncbi:Uncharacterised protein [Mycobacteroides abscessus]|nr:Uncharacterised protein [Mycobacteroides abscessus]